MKQTCILILGMHRGGTSALSGTLNILDVYLGSDLMKPMEHNPKGFFENNLLYKINEKLLKQMGSSWDDDFYDENKLNAIKEITELEQAIGEEFKCSQLFAIKDPRLAYLLPIYIKALNNLNIEIKVIIPFRNPLEVADSLKARNNFCQEKGLLLWAYHFLLSEKLSRDLPRVYTRFDDLVQTPDKVIALIDQVLELDLLSKYEKKQDEVHDFLTPCLKHHNTSNNNLSEKVPKIIRDIVRLSPDLNENNLTQQLDDLRNQLFGYQGLFYNADISKKIAELGQAKQGLQGKDKELEQARQGIQDKGNELEQAMQGLQSKDKELEQARQGMQAKNKELEQVKQGFQGVDKELEQTRQVLQAKDNELEQAKKKLLSKEQELVSLKTELVNIYLSKSWKITRPLRLLIRRFRK